jgi:hypothetical protein
MLFDLCSQLHTSSLLSIMAISFAEREASKYPEFGPVYRSLADAYSAK